ncbi:phosphomannomutase CpsG [Moellerella wisconsensis]|uniref:phosphomannomutase CpsG n=1 Tax=Moellerella wisconsensis TaxID=158849 RepID=UPI001F4E9D69|nr:phosphomannomutase CpsG [Moellerella wisconsensis]UNH41718.1 phosphomannomutase CpsG [Moellerella wisconsensis]
MTELTCFKAYDIRGKLGTELNIDIAYRIGRAYGIFISSDSEKNKSVVIGGDIRLTSNELKQAISDGLMDSGINVIDLGMTGTEEIYFATQYLKVDGGIQVTASHNPINYNGMKLVREDAKPISNDTGLLEIKKLAENTLFKQTNKIGYYQKKSILKPYIEHLMSYISIEKIRPMKLVVNSGNGAAGHVIDEIEKYLHSLNIPIEFIKVHHEPDGNFPNGIPNPLLPECRYSTSRAVINHKADIGIAWDGDFDRCFLFDENGKFIEGYYIVGLLAQSFIKKNPDARIIHDPRLYWNTVDIVKTEGGNPILSKTGHAFIKEKMRKENAIYGGEMSAHHYFRDFSYCDSGMIPWLLVIELLSEKKLPLSEMVKDRINKYPSSGEINFKLNDPKSAIEKVYYYFIDEAISKDNTDGISLEFENWRFNLRISNTENLVRLNVEAKHDFNLMESMTKKITSILTS